MKRYWMCGLLFLSFVYFANGSIDEERRFREGNSFSRKMRSCGLFCSLKGNRGSYNQTRCYRIPSQNVVATDCVFRCLRSKGESPVAEECKCSNGVCVEEATTAPETDAATEQPTQTTTDSAATEGTNPPQNNRRNGNQGKKGAKGQNSKKTDRTERKS